MEEENAELTKKYRLFNAYREQESGLGVKDPVTVEFDGPGQKVMYAAFAKLKKVEM